MVVHGHVYFIGMANKQRKRKGPYCDNNYVVATLVCTTFPMDKHIYLFISLNYDYMFIIASTLSMFRHTRELKKIHHLIVVEYACVNEFIGNMVNLAQMLACNLLPLMSFLQS